MSCEDEGAVGIGGICSGSRSSRTRTSASFCYSRMSEADFSASCPWGSAAAVDFRVDRASSCFHSLLLMYSASEAMNCFSADSLMASFIFAHSSRILSRQFDINLAVPAWGRLRTTVD